MRKAIAHLRGNVVAYLALFVALGGTSYAAISIPANSVGSRQLKNGAVTPVKLDASAMGGYVLYWAQISAQGAIVDSRPRGARTTSWNDNAALGLLGGPVTWGRAIPSECFALAGAAALPVPGVMSGSVSVNLIAGSSRFANVYVNPSVSVATNVAVICPIAGSGGQQHATLHK